MGARPLDPCCRVTGGHDVEIDSAAGQVYYDIPGPDLAANVWHRFSLPLDGSGWRFSAGDALRRRPEAHRALRHGDTSRQALVWWRVGWQDRVTVGRL